MVKQLMAWLLVLCCWTAPAWAAPKLAWFTNLPTNPRNHDGFWKLAHHFAKAAAEDLGVQLDIYYSARDHMRMVAQVHRTLKDPLTRPDGILVHNYKHIGHGVLRMAAEYGVEVLVFNAGFEEIDKVGAPRGKFPNWIGVITPDDEFAGKLLTEHLTQAMLQLSPAPSKPLALGFQGGMASPASAARMAGFQATLPAEIPLSQWVPADWDFYKAKDAFPAMLQRYPEIKLVWCANDQMALGVIAAAQAQGWKPGQDFVVGGIDWLIESIQAVREGQQAVTVGGHFVEAAWAVILLTDYLRGHDFLEVQPAIIKTKSFYALTRENLATFGNLDEKLDYSHVQKIDFRALSRSANPELKAYDFSLERLLRQL